MNWEVSSLDELRNSIPEIARAVGEGRKIVLLNGEMGAGKTTIVSLMLPHMGVKDEISSPTFSIVNEYEYNNQKVYHFDFYRVDENEAMDFGVEEYFDSGNLCLLEWPEKIQGILPTDYSELKIELLDDLRTRKITFHP